MKESRERNIYHSALSFIYIYYLLLSNVGLFLCTRSNVRFLMIAMAYAVPTGVIAGWTGVLDMILTPAKVSQVGRIPVLTHTHKSLSAGGCV